MTEPDRKLFLAIPDSAYKSFFQKEFPKMVIQQYQLNVLIYDVEDEVIISWSL